jgi:hypothetical protein
VKQAVVNEMLDRMQRHRFIEESESPWSSAVVLFREKIGEIRFCVDYRKLNEVTKRDCFALPLIEEAGAKWFSNLDFKSGYWQIDVHPDDNVNKRHFSPCNDSATFEILMETVLRGLTYDASLVYLDDVIIFGCTFQEHHLNLRNVLERFREACLKLNPG